MLICAGIVTVSKFFRNKFVVISVTALVVTFIDLIIEQVAQKLDFWQFEGGLPGLHNYLGWIGVVLFTSYIFYPAIIKGHSKVSSIVLILQIIFFTSLLIFI